MAAFDQAWASYPDDENDGSSKRHCFANCLASRCTGIRSCLRSSAGSTRRKRNSLAIGSRTSGATTVAHCLRPSYGRPVVKHATQMLALRSDVD